MVAEATKVMALAGPFLPLQQQNDETDSRAPHRLEELIGNPTPMTLTHAPGGRGST